MQDGPVKRQSDPRAAGGSGYSTSHAKPSDPELEASLPSRTSPLLSPSHPYARRISFPPTPNTRAIRHILRECSAKPYSALFSSPYPRHGRLMLKHACGREQWTQQTQAMTQQTRASTHCVTLRRSALKYLCPSLL